MDRQSKPLNIDIWENVRPWSIIIVSGPGELKGEIMSTSFWIILSAFAGFFVGLFVASLCNAASMQDRSHYWWDEKDLKR